MKEAWNDISNEVDELIFTTPLPDSRVLSLALPESSSILDIGCGYGRVLKHMYEMGYRDLTGIDVSEKLIGRARRFCPEATYHIGDIERVQLEQRYDLILIMGVIEYVLSDEDQREFFDKVRKMLNPNGHVLLETFVLDSANMWQYIVGLLKTGHWGRFKNSKGFGCHHQSYAMIDELVTEFFEVVSLVRQNFLTWTGYQCNGYSLILKVR